MTARCTAVTRSTRLFAGVLFVASILIVSLAQAQETGGSSKPESVLREFYQWYVQSVAANRSPMTDERAKLKRYATDGMLRRIDRLAKADELGADPFLQAQDIDDAWAKNIKVSKPEIAGNVATATVELKGREMSQKLAVTLRQESGTWKVDKVDPK